jgi:hypothetical protein
MSKMSKTNDTQSVRLAFEEIILSAEQFLLGAPLHGDIENLAELGSELILIFDRSAGRDDLKQRAAHAVAMLARSSPVILDLVIGNAAQYAKNRHICDSGFYHPNGFDVLVEIGPNDRVLSFLHKVVDRDYSVVEFEAAWALSAISCPCPAAA